MSQIANQIYDNNASNGDLPVYTGKFLELLRNGAAGQILTSNGPNEKPSWENNTSGFITSVDNTSTITLDVTGGELTADFASMNISQFTNDSGYTTNTGTVTSVAALTIETTGTDLSSTVANGTTTPVIILNVPTASATNRGVLSSTDWSTFNGKQNALGYTAENSANKTATVIGNESSTTLYANIKGLVDWVKSVNGNIIVGKYSGSPVSVTSTVSETQYSGVYVLIPANTFAVGSRIGFEYDCIRNTSGTSAGTHRVRVSTSSAPSPLSGATLIATNSSSAANNVLVPFVRRHIFVNSATDTIALSTGYVSDEWSGPNSNTTLSANIDWTVDQYFIPTIQPGNSGDTYTLNSFKVYLR
jgi:hypothetical protein